VHNALVTNILVELVRIPLFIFNELAKFEVKINRIVIVYFQQVQKAPIFYPIILPEKISFPLPTV